MAAGAFASPLRAARFLVREVLLASGAYTTSATPALRKKVIPIGSYIIATEVLPADLARELSPRNRMIYDSKHFLYYYRLTPDNRMLFGGRAAFFPESENTVRESAELLRQGMIERLSAVARHQSGICVGRHARFHVRRHAAFRKARRHALCRGFCRSWRGRSHLDGRETCRRDLRRPRTTIRFPEFPFPVPHSACAAETPGRCLSREFITACWTTSPEFRRSTAARSFGNT